MRLDRRVHLIASQIPQQELGLVGQLLQHEGFEQQPLSERKKNSHAIIFYSSDGDGYVDIKFYQEIGILRVVLEGVAGMRVSSMIGQYFQSISVEKVKELLEKSRSMVEKRVYGILWVLCYANGEDALSGIGMGALESSEESVLEGIVQGFAFLESSDAGEVLELIEKIHVGTRIAELARKAIDGLSEQGLIYESLDSLRLKLLKMIDTDAEGVLKILEQDEREEVRSAFRYLQARAYRILGRADEAESLLTVIQEEDVDAAEAFRERALHLEERQERQLAVKDIERAYRLDPENESIASDYARLQLVQGVSEVSFEERLERLDQAILGNSKDVALYFERASLYLEHGEYSKAREDLLVVAGAGSGDLRLPAMLCEACLGMGYLGEALLYAQEASSQFVPKRREASKLLKGRVYFGMGLYERALASFKEVYGTEKSEAALLGMALCYAYLGQSEESEGCLKHLDRGKIDEYMKALKVRLVKEVSFLEGYPIESVYPKVLGLEPVDSLFKRCVECGSLSMGRRSFCKSCGGSEFLQ